MLFLHSGKQILQLASVTCSNLIVVGILEPLKGPGPTGFTFQTL